MGAARLCAAGRIHESAGNRDAARADWGEAETRLRHILDRIGQTGPNAELEQAALKLLSEALVATDRTVDAITLRRQFLGRQMDGQVRASNWGEIAKCYALLGDYGQEEHALRKALALESGGERPRAKAETADLTDRLGLALKRQGKLAAAQAEWEQALAMYQDVIDHPPGRRRDREHRLAYSTRLQSVYERLGRWPDAIRSRRGIAGRAAEICLPDDPKLWLLKVKLAGLYRRGGRNGKGRHAADQNARPLAAQGPSAAPELVPTLIDLSRVARKQNDLKQAQQYAGEAVKLAETAPSGHELEKAEAFDALGDVLADGKQYNNAVDQYMRAIRYLPRPAR